MKTNDLLVALLALIVGLALGWLLAGQQSSVPVAQMSPSYLGAAVADGSSNARSAAVAVPAHAVQIAPGLYDLGTRIVEGKAVQGYMIVDYKKGRFQAKPSGCNFDGKCQGYEDQACADCQGGPDGGGGGKSKCFDFIARNAKWKTVEDYMVDTSNLRGLGDAFIRENLTLDINKWELAAGVNIIGNEIANAVDGVDLVRPDGKNEVLFANIESPGAIAVTVIWGIFSGPPSGRELIEWDQVYDDVDFDWSEDCVSNDCTITGKEKMDFENIATHELGHSFGLGDLYTNKCSEETMYGYSAEGEIMKRDLNAGDIVGIKELYN